MTTSLSPDDTGDLSDDRPVENPPDSVLLACGRNLRSSLAARALAVGLTALALGTEHPSSAQVQCCGLTSYYDGGGTVAPIGYCYDPPSCVGDTRLATMQWTASLTGCATVSAIETTFGLPRTPYPSGPFNCVAGQTYLIGAYGGGCASIFDVCFTTQEGISLSVHVEPAEDCNQNSISDSCDIAAGTSQDVNGNGIPDECETPRCTLGTLTASDAGALDRFGYYLAVDGARVLVGAYSDDGPGGVDQGAAYVYRRNGVTLTQEQKLVAEDGLADDLFGVGVVIQGNWAVVGAPFSDGLGSNSGAVYVFQRSTSTGVWSQDAKFFASDTNAEDLFGSALEWNGDLLFVSAVTRETVVGPDRGKVYVFRWNGATFSEEAHLYAPVSTPLDHFGNALDYDDYNTGRLAVGAYLADTTNGVNSGAVYVYRPSGASWLLEQSLPGSQAGVKSGLSVSLEGDLLAVGEPEHPGLGASAGSVSVWRHDSTALWAREWSLVAPDTDAGDWFGRSVLIEGNKLFVGAPFNSSPVGTGTVDCFTRWPGGWTRPDRDYPSLMADGYGIDMAYANGLLAVGAYATPTAGQSTAGSATVLAVLGPDCNTNLACDFCEIQTGTASDSNGDGRPDECHYKARRYTGPVLTMPVTTDRDRPHARSAAGSEDATDPSEDGTRLREFTPPAQAPLMLVWVAGARVEISDGVERHVLYEPEPGDGAMSVFADISELFPDSSSGTVFRLVAHPLGDQVLLGQPRFHGGARLRNDEGRNELAFVSARTPVAGEEWECWVDVSSHPKALDSVVWASSAAFGGRSSPFGTMLIDVTGTPPLFTSIVPSRGGTDVHRIPIPPQAFGRSFSLQALIREERRSFLTNAIDIVIGR